MDSLRYKNRKPTHPGALLREVFLPELGITQGELAEQLGVSRRTVSEVLHERRPVTPDFALRLGRYVGNGAAIWLRMQQALDLWQLERNKAAEYKHITPHRQAA